MIEKQNLRFPMRTTKICVLMMIISLMLSCQSIEKCAGSTAHRELTTGARGPKRLYVPEYYVYSNGKYEFVKGHYRLVMFPKLYVKRSMKGYVTNREHSASIR